MRKDRRIPDEARLNLELIKYTKQKINPLSEFSVRMTRSYTTGKNKSTAYLPCRRSYTNAYTASYDCAMMVVGFAVVSCNIL